MEKGTYLLSLLLLCATLFSQTNPENYTREWGTYFGDNDISIISSALDDSGNLWIAGNVEGTSSFLDTLVTANAHQPIYGGGDKDGFIVKFSSQCELLYASYFGGENRDNIFSIDVKNNKVYVVGTTYSTTNISSSGSFQENLNSNIDPNGNLVLPRGAFIAQFDSIGQLQWSTYFQGNLYTDLLDIKAGYNNDLFVWGDTWSSDLGTPGSFKPTIPSPYFNGSEYVAPRYPILARFDDTGQLLWATYYGPDINNSSITASYSAGGLAVDTMNNVYVAGMSQDTSDFYGTLGAHQPSNAGLVDIFLSKFSPSGQRIWSTYYGGEQVEMFAKIHVPRDDFIYLTGVTFSETGIATSGAYQFDGYTYPDDGFARFLTKFDLTGQRVWGTYLHNSNQNTVGVTMDVDIFNTPFVYQVLPNVSDATTEGSWQENYSGGASDFSLLKIKPSGDELEWGTYYGGKGHESMHGAFGIYISNHISISDDNYIFITGSTTSTNNIASENAFQPSIPQFSNSNFLAKFIPCPPAELPVAASPQEYSFGATLDDLDVGFTEWSGSTLIITWYADEDGTIELPPDTELENGATYYVSQTIQGCDESDLAAVTVTACTQPGPPVGNETQGFEPGDTLDDLDVSGSNLIWYADEDRTIILLPGTPLQDGETYYVSQTVDSCESELLAITVMEGLGLGENDLNRVVLYPNPNDGTFVIEGLPATESKLILYDLQGRIVYQTITQQKKHHVMLESRLATGVYLLQIDNQQQTSVFRVVVE